MKVSVALLLYVANTFDLFHRAAAPSKCIEDRYDALKNRLRSSQMIPDCDSKGNYNPIQCDISSGYCFCVDQYGNKRHGTDTAIGQPGPTCKTISSCERERTAAVNQKSLAGTFIPLCDTRGDYLPKQCQPSEDICWCVDSDGLEIESTRNETVNCRPDGPCTRANREAKEKSKRLSTCNNDGSYRSLQCDDSFCWCVDSEGREIAGARASAGDTSPICHAEPVT